MALFQSLNLTQEPLVRINKWLQEAIEFDIALPHAMNLSTVDSKGQPSSRMVLLKTLSDDGITFYTDYTSLKGEHLENNPQAALNFWWAKTDKQIRVEGTCSKISSRDSDAYFKTRPTESQISAFVSNQSKILESYESLLKSVKELEKSSMGEHIERPERWGGFKLKPTRIEFWASELNRLHKRELFTLASTRWEKTLLSP